MKFIFSKSFSNTLAKLANIEYPKWEKPTNDFIESKVIEYQEIWDKEIEEFYNRFLISNLLKRPEHLECFVVAGISRNMSHPITLKSRYTKDEFIPAVLEEVLHRTFAYNKTPITQISENSVTNTHYDVFKALKEILKTMDKLTLYEQFKQEHKDPNYLLAFELVDKK